MFVVLLLIITTNLIVIAVLNKKVVNKIINVVLNFNLNVSFGKSNQMIKALFFGEGYFNLLPAPKSATNKAEGKLSVVNMAI